MPLYGRMPGAPFQDDLGRWRCNELLEPVDSAKLAGMNEEERIALKTCDFLLREDSDGLWNCVLHGQRGLPVSDEEGAS